MGRGRTLCSPQKHLTPCCFRAIPVGGLALLRLRCFASTRLRWFWEGEVHGHRSRHCSLCDSMPGWSHVAVRVERNEGAGNLARGTVEEIPKMALLRDVPGKAVLSDLGVPLLQ